MTTPSVTGFAYARDAVPTVGTTAERDARYPSPPAGFKVYNVEVGFFQRYTGSAWSSILTPSPTYDVRDYGAVWNGTTNDTAAVQGAVNAAATAGGGIVVLPAGTGVVGPIDWPGSSVVPLMGKVHIRGQGVGHTTVIQATANTPIFRHAASAATLTEGVVLAGMTLKPATTTTSGALIDLAGFRTSLLDELEYRDNGAGDPDSFITLAARRTGYTVSLCYGCELRRIVCAGTTVFTGVVIQFENDGSADALYNANATLIRNLWVYANNLVTCVVDGRRSAQTSLDGGLIEANTVADAVRLGTAMRVAAVFLESNAADLVYATGADGASNTTLVESCYFSDIGTVTIPSGCDNNLVLNCIEAASGTWNDSGAGNLIQRGSLVESQEATIARTARWTSRRAGAGDWDWALGITGGTYAAGALALVDRANSKTRWIFEALGRSRVFSGAAGTAAARFIPFTGAGSATPVVEVTDAAEGSTLGFIEAGGDLNFGGGHRQTIDGWYQEDAAASQSAVALSRLATTTEAPTRWIAVRPGSVTGVNVKSNAARVAGTLTILVYKNGSVLGSLTAVLDGTNTTFHAATQSKDVDTFAAGDELELRITTDGSWSPVTADIRAALEIET